MKKILTIVLLSVLLVSCGTKNDNKKDIKTNKKTEQKVEKFWDVTKYIKSNITDQESEELAKILKERKEIQKEISNSIKNLKPEDDKTKIYTEIVEKRKNMEEKIIKYVTENQKLLFKAYFDKYNRIIKKTLDNK